MPDIKIQLFIDTENAAVASAIAHKVEGDTTALIDHLGIPGRPVVSTNLERLNDDQVIRIIVNGNVCRYHAALPAMVHGYVYDGKGGVSERSKKWHEKSFWMPSSPDEEHKLAAFSAMMVMETLKLNPSTLLGAEHFKTYLQSLELSNSKTIQNPEELENLIDVFRDILELKISIVDKARISKTINDRYGSVSLNDLRESLIAELSSGEVVMLFNKEYFKAITAKANEGTNKDEDLIGLMRDGLFYELGIRYPEFRIKFSNTLRPGTFQFKINDLLTCPLIGLSTAECLVNDTVDRLSLLNIKGVVAINPANGYECSIVHEADCDIARQAGFTTWDSLAYFILCFSAVLKDNTQCFINNNFVTTAFEKLKTAWPKLVDTISNRYSVDIISKTIRLLMAEELSIRNLRQIIVSLLEADFITTDPQRYIVFDNRLPERFLPEGYREKPELLAEYVRSKMKEYISHKYTRGSNTLIVYLVDPVLEDIMNDPSSLSDEGTNKILEAIESEIDLQAKPAEQQVILTVNTARAPLKELIKKRLPDMAVVAYTELAPSINIRPIGRISIN